MFDDYIIAYPERIYNTFEKCYNSINEAFLQLKQEMLLQREYAEFFPMLIQ